MALHHNAKIATNGLKLALDAANVRSYSGSGASWQDISLTKNHALLVNSPAFEASPKHFVFSGSNCRGTLATAFAGGTFVAASVWYRRNEVDASSTWRTLLATLTTNVHHLIVHQSTREIGIFDGSWRSFGFETPNDNQFHNYAVVYRQAQSATLFVDAEEVSTVNTSLNWSNSPLASIGNWNTGNYWAGHIASVMLYDRELTSDEIFSNYVAWKGRFE